MIETAAFLSPRMPQTPDSAEEPIFVLDIGTRSVIGIVGRRTGELFEVLGLEEQEHTKRAMVDGQIEDIEETAAVARRVKTALEEQLGLRLGSVFVAAAGRALRTQQTSAGVTLDPKENITQKQISELELLAIEEAYRMVSGTGEEEESLYCVGHSVMKYHLDGYPISTLLGHRGKEAQVELIATFLPNEVVESLYSAMSKIQCTVSSITLEPIAAMNAIIPQELRMLNLALVDIGAGTSDIAISDKGSVVAYTMATVAGDEITEAVIQQYLVDFETAEQMKRDYSAGLSAIEYQDILGLSYAVDAREFAEKLAPAVESLCGEICSRILEANHKAPAAVFLVGGGSQLPGMCRMVAENLSMDVTKVAVGGNNYMKRMISAKSEMTKPEYATPMGIAITAMYTRERGSIPVTVNGKELRLFKNSAMTVMDVLLMSGFKHSQLIGRSGKSVTYTLDGERRVVRGEYAISAVITIGGKAASISTSVSAGDVIVVEPSVSGRDAAPLVRDAVEDWTSFSVTLEGAPVAAGTVVHIDGVPVPGERQIANGEALELHRVETLADLIAETGLDGNTLTFLVDGSPEEEDYLLRAGDDIRYLARGLAQAAPVVAPVPEPVSGPEPVDVEGKPLRILLNGSEVELYPKVDGSPYLFVDLLNFVDIDPSRPQGNILLRLGDRTASYLDVVSDGDRAEIRWEGVSR